MPSSAVRIFSDPDDYAAAFRTTRAECTITGRGRFTAKLIRIDFHRLWMHRYSDNLPRVAHSATINGRAIISFRTRPGPSQLSGGAEMHPTNIARLPEGVSSFLHSSGSASWGAMSLPMEDMDAFGVAMVGCDLTAPRDRLIVTPPIAVMAKLRRLHEMAGQLAEDAPEIIAHPEAARGLEQALIDAMVGCLGGRGVREDASARRNHSLIMRRFHRAVEENPEQSLYIPELCAAIGVPDRTLRVCCQEQLGMSPKRYLLLRRMNLARRALLDGSPGTTTVTAIATQYGFWQFGRFAGEYKSLFGEAPSVTLHRPHE
jgi:AraC-like DNA-binding protein